LRNENAQLRATITELSLPSTSRGLTEEHVKELKKARVIHQANQKLQEQLKKLQESHTRDSQETQRKLTQAEESLTKKDEEILALKA